MRVTFVDNLMEASRINLYFPTKVEREGGGVREMDFVKFGGKSIGHNPPIVATGRHLTR